jgi:hypothetical protein
MMLDVLFKIKDELDPTLAFRRSCRSELPLPGTDTGMMLLRSHHLQNRDVVIHLAAF